MMGRSHVVSGVATGAIAAQGISALPGISLTTSSVIAFSLIAAGASALNDLDHPQSSATRVLGPLTGILSRLVQSYARLIYLATRGPGDPRIRGAHRGATHALPLLPLPCAVLGVAPWVLSKVHPWAGQALIAAVMTLCLVVAVDRMGVRLVAVLFAAAISGGVVSGDVSTTLISLAPWVALAVLVGTITHVLGDAVTEYGVPVWAPLYRTNPGTSHERRWVRIKLPSWLAFRTGGWFEQIVMFPTLVVGAALAMPGVFSAVMTALN